MKDPRSIISIQELLKGRNFEFDQTSSDRIKMIRHADTRLAEGLMVMGEMYYGSLYNLYRTNRDKFLRYQSEQKKNYFLNIDYIVVFIGEEGLNSRFIGVYRNNGVVKSTSDDSCIFSFQEIEGFDILKERVIIDWKTPTTGWHQCWYNTKEVIRIDEGLEHNDIPIFTRYEDVILSYHELYRIIKSNDSEWKSKLEACNCVYVITDMNNGKQYVGVTYKDISQGKKNGIWNRWSEYAESGHGGDITLVKLCADNPDYAKDFFQWSILETLPLNVIPKIAIARESLYKEKLGTRRHGYNNN